MNAPACCLEKVSRLLCKERQALWSYLIEETELGARGDKVVKLENSVSEIR